WSSFWTMISTAVTAFPWARVRGFQVPIRRPLVLLSGGGGEMFPEVIIREGSGLGSEQSSLSSLESKSVDGATEDDAASVLLRPLQLLLLPQLLLSLLELTVVVTALRPKWPVTGGFRKTVAKLLLGRCLCRWRRYFVRFTTIRRTADSSWAHLSGDGSARRSV